MILICGTCFEKDWKYLQYRIELRNLMHDFEEILKAFKIDIDKQYQKIAKEIIDNFGGL